MADESDSERPSVKSGAIQKADAPDRSSRPMQRPPEWVERFLEIQQQELKVRSEEVALRAKESELGHEYAVKSLEVTAADRKDERQNKSEDSKRRYGVAVLAVLLGAGLLVFLVWQGKDKLAEELVKAAIYIAAAGLGGYAWGRRKGEEKSRSEEPPDSGPY